MYDAMVLDVETTLVTIQYAYCITTTNMWPFGVFQSSPKMTTRNNSDASFHKLL